MVILEVVRSLFFLSLTAWIGALMFSGFWFFEQFSWGEEAKATLSPVLRHAYTSMRATAWNRIGAWLLLDIGLLVLTGMFAWLWRYVGKKVDDLQCLHPPG
ncbi:MAG: hypothetical protein K6T83_09170 [Alicyclobacillus sp.]|nr:hypothetical protein [Alicyclobacillus sp.]